MLLVPDITAGTGTESDETPLVALWGCRSRKEHTRWPFPSMGFFSGGAAIWELVDPRSTLRQVGGTVEFLTLATFRDAGISSRMAHPLNFRVPDHPGRCPNNYSADEETGAAGLPGGIIQG